MRMFIIFVITFQRCLFEIFSIIEVFCGRRNIYEISSAK